ncbi:MAG TPA: J domain-containing protein [Acidimicrobiales bacterium]
MDVHEARAVLGVSRDDGWDEVRSSYRRLIRVAHPDVAVEASPHRAAALNEAYAVLSRARRERAPRPGTAPPPPPPPRPAPPTSGAQVVGEDTLLLAAPPEEAFGALLDAGHHLGAISYVDRSCAILEVIVRLDGEACSLLVTLQRRGHGTEALLSVESLSRVASHSPAPMARALLHALG